MYLGFIYCPEQLNACVIKEVNSIINDEEHGPMIQVMKKTLHFSVFSVLCYVKDIHSDNIFFSVKNRYEMNAF